MSGNNHREVIHLQREKLTAMLSDEMHRLAVSCRHLDEVIPIMNGLITEHGVFHGKLHFSSSRATIWLVDDLFIYRILSIGEIIDPDICLAYPRRVYLERTVVPSDEVVNIFENFRSLCFADENVYLLAGSLNVINGMVGLNFSCDGSHYMRYDEFLDKNLDFWFGDSDSALAH